MSRRKYGIPYIGSKASICDKLIWIFPKADNFYDLFGGGFSVTHAMLVNRRHDYKNFFFNEIRPGICDLIQDAIDGKYSYDRFLPKWVEREEFFEKLEKDPYIKMIWSFGNDGKSYLFSKKIEPYKKSMHQAIVFNEFDDLAKKVLGMDHFAEFYSITQRRLFLRAKIEQYRITKIPDFLIPFLQEKQLQQLRQLDRLQQLRQLEQLEQLQQLERLQRLRQLERLQQLQQLERLEQLQQLEKVQQFQLPKMTTKSYEEVDILPNSVVYCDIPYRGTGKYDQNLRFNHQDFYDWADSQSNPVYISEYNLPDKRFTSVFQIEKRSMFSSNKTVGKKLEQVFANKAGVEALMGRSCG